MYHRCTWCNSRITFQPIYYTQGFLQLSPGFGVYCNAACSLSAHGANSSPRETDQNQLLELESIE